MLVAYNVKTEPHADGKIEQVVESVADGVRTVILRQVFDSMEEQVRTSLMKLGWIAPHRNADAAINSLMPNTRLMIDIKAGFDYLDPPADTATKSARIQANMVAMSVARRLGPLIREMVITGLLHEQLGMRVSEGVVEGREK
jgi:hypothetical protein